MKKYIRRSIFFKITFSIATLLVVSMGISATVSFYNTHNAILNASIKETEQVTALTKMNLIVWLNDRKTEVANLGQRRVFKTALGTDFVAKTARKSVRKRLKKFTKGSDLFISGALVDATGTIIASSVKADLEQNISAEPFFQDTLKANPASFPVGIDADTDSVHTIIASPIKDGDSIIGVLLVKIDLGYFTSRFIDEIKLGKTGFVFLVENTGSIIAHRDKSILITTNIAEFVWGEELLNRKNGATRYQEDGHEKMVIFNEIAEMGWVIAASVDFADIKTVSNRIAAVNLIVSAVIIIIAVLLSLAISRNISRPMIEMSKVMEQIKKGRFDNRIGLKNRIDEIGLVGEALNSLAEDLQSAVSSISIGMKHVANGDLSRKIEENLQGDLGRLKTDINKSMVMLGNTLMEVIQNSSQVYASSSELASSSQALATGSTEQASSLEAVTSSVDEIETRAGRNKDNSAQAHVLAKQALEEVKSANRQMEAMLTSMREINDTSSEVSKVIKVIDEIASQTNLLALNAAVEAARAGKFGKGFAVVADEVRSLASRSSQAAKSTTDLIENSGKEIEHGMANADRTAEILGKIYTSIENVNHLIGQISNGSEAQKNAIGEISRSLDQASNVVRRNTAISEEIASSSEEISAQTKGLYKKLDNFTLPHNTPAIEFVENTDLV